jgi:predicted nucleic-acid-binding Zn-ribbon protein
MESEKIGVWEVYFCPTCKAHQAEVGFCKKCQNKNLIRREIQDAAEYCQLFGHEFRTTGVKSLGRGEWNAYGLFRFPWPYLAVRRCIRCECKDVVEVKDNSGSIVGKANRKSWGEQP